MNHASVRSRPHYAGGIWKRNFISQLRSSVNTNRSRKRSFSKTLFKPEEFENAGFAFNFNVDRKHLETKLFINYDLTIIIIFPYPCFTQTQAIVAFSNSSGVVWAELNIWCVFTVKPPFSNPFGVVCKGPQTALKVLWWFAWSFSISSRIRSNLLGLRQARRTQLCKPKVFRRFTLF